MKSKPTRAILMLNPYSGRGRGGRVAEALMRYLRSLRVEAELRVATSREEGLKIASEARQRWDSEGWQFFLVAGGDGTINSAAAALAGSDIPVGILPVGGANVAARQLGLPLSLRAACRTAVLGEQRIVDLGVANGRPFVALAGIGFDAAVVHSLRESMKQRLGPLAFVLRALKMAADYRYVPITVAIQDGQFLDQNWLVVVTNGRTYTYYWNASLGAVMDDGQLDVCMFSKTSALGVANQVLYALAGRHLALPTVRCLRARGVRVEAEGRVCVQVDGEPAGFTPVEVSCLPGAMRVLVPAGPASVSHGRGGNG